MYYINLYFVGCFIGYLVETFLKTFVFHSMNNGILYGPWIPVYGFGILISIIITNYIYKRKINVYLKIIISFIILVLLITLLEEMGGVIIELVFKCDFWNYKNMPFHVGKYISIEMSLLWGVLSLLFINYIKPLLDLFIKKIPKVITLSILFIHLIDIIITWLI